MPKSIIQVRNLKAGIVSFELICFIINDITHKEDSYKPSFNWFRFVLAPYNILISFWPFFQKGSIVQNARKNENICIQPRESIRLRASF